MSCLCLPLPPPPALIVFYSFSSFKMVCAMFLLNKDRSARVLKFHQRVGYAADHGPALRPHRQNCRWHWVAVAASSHQPTKADLSSVTPISRCCLLVLGLLHINAWSTLIMSVRITARDFELVVDTLNKPLR
ncbi:hypothetical protein KCU99_g167, partial [Aureobasidium melanogenum]